MHQRAQVSEPEGRRQVPLRHASSTGLLGLQRQAGNRAVTALVGGGVPVIQRTSETAAAALFAAGQKKVFVSTFTTDFNAAHEVTKADQKAVQAALDALSPVAAVAAPKPGTVTEATLFSVTKGNSGGQSYSPSGDVTPHISVEWSAPAAKGGVYTIKKLHYKTTSGKYFWWATISGGHADFDSSTMGRVEHNAAMAAANAKAAKIAPRLNITLGAIPAK